jgi:hypothetical protein
MIVSRNGGSITSSPLHAPRAVTAASATNEAGRAVRGMGRSERRLAMNADMVM